MNRTRLAGMALFGAAVAGCGGSSNFPENNCGDVAGTCIEVRGGDSAALLDAVNSVAPNTTIILGKGSFVLSNAVTIRTAGVHLIGQGMDKTVLDFGSAAAQINGIDVIGNDFLVQDLTVLDAKKDGIRVESSDGVVFRRIRATWTTPGQTSNGAYGIYPVQSRNVLVEDSEAFNASDAGLYVGQCEHVIVRRNTVRDNVAGLEIENTQFADVYENLAEGNTAGIVVFDLPGNPIVGRDVRVRDNTIINNNGINFGALGTTVAAIPSGTGTFAMASRRVEITGNTYQNNGTVDIALLSGLAIEKNVAMWTLDTASLVGTWEDLGLLSAGVDQVSNFRSENIVIANNTHMDSGQAPPIDDPEMFGLMLNIAFLQKRSMPAPNIIYDTIGETTFDAAVAANNTNDNHVCIGGNAQGNFASIDLPTQLATSGNGSVLVLDPPFAPFDCTTLNGGAVAPVVLPGN